MNIILNINICKFIQRCLNLCKRIKFVDLSLITKDHSTIVLIVINYCYLHIMTNMHVLKTFASVFKV